MYSVYNYADIVYIMRNEGPIIPSCHGKTFHMS